MYDELGPAELARIQMRLTQSQQLGLSITLLLFTSILNKMKINCELLNGV